MSNRPNLILQAYALTVLLTTIPVAMYAQECPQPINEGFMKYPSSQVEEVVLLVPRINERLLYDGAYVLMIKGLAYVSGADLEKWHLQEPGVPPLRYLDGDYYPLHAIEGLSYQIDDRNQELLIEGGQGIFRNRTFDGLDSSITLLTPPSTGGFLNYDVQYYGDHDDQRVSALLESGIFNSLGIATSSFMRRHDAEQITWVRLDTTLTRDWPERRESLRIGDAVTRAGAWGRPVRFGGVQWGTNFATQPGFITFPLPTLSGEAVLPSTVDIYINNVLRHRRDVPPGPFEIPGVPVVTGAGEVSLVVQDLLGRETMVTQPYYASPALLRAGLIDYSFELGYVREDFGLRSNNYGRGLAVATYRMGLSDTLTGELRTELLRGQQAAGVVGTYLWPSWGTLVAGFALSRSDERGGGAFTVFGIDRRSRSFSVDLRTQLATADFTQVGLPSDRPTPRQITSAHVGWAFGPGSITLSYVMQDWRDQDDIAVASANYNVGLGRFFISFFAIHTRSESENNTIGLTATVPLGKRTSASVHHSRKDGRVSTLYQVQRNLPAGEGAGFRVLLEGGSLDRAEAGLAYQGRIGTYTLETSRTQGVTSHRLSVSGGVAVMGGSAFLTRQIRESFGVVRVGDYGDVRIYAENQEIGRTDRHGRLLVPRLLAYQPNLLGIEQADLPIDAEIETLQKKVAPYYRSGVVVDFPVRATDGALLILILEDGTPLPAGAVVTVFGREEETFPVAENGRVFVTRLADRNRIKAAWREQNCTIEFDLPPKAEPLPELSPFVCRGVHP